MTESNKRGCYKKKEYYDTAIAVLKLTVEHVTGVVRRLEMYWVPKGTYYTYVISWDVGQFYDITQGVVIKFSGDETKDFENQTFP